MVILGGLYIWLLGCFFVLWIGCWFVVCLGCVGSVLSEGTSVWGFAMFDWLCLVAYYGWCLVLVWMWLIVVSWCCCFGCFVWYSSFVFVLLFPGCGCLCVICCWLVC